MEEKTTQQKEAERSMTLRRAQLTRRPAALSGREEGRASRKAAHGDLLGLYLDGIRKFPLLTAQGEVELAQCIERDKAKISQIILRCPDALLEAAPRLDPGLVACLSQAAARSQTARPETRANAKGDGNATQDQEEDDRLLCRMRSIFDQIGLEDAELKAFIRKLRPAGEWSPIKEPGRRGARGGSAEAIRRIRYRKHRKIHPRATG